MAQCLGCAAIDRGLARLGLKLTEECERCLQRYCWNSKIVEGIENGAVVDLPLKLNLDESFAAWNANNTF